MAEEREVHVYLLPELVPPDRLRGGVAVVVDVLPATTSIVHALVDFLFDLGAARLNDGARLAWDCFETHGCCLEAALELSQGGRHLKGLGFEEDIQAAAQVDAFALVPELRPDPLRVEVGAAGVAKSYWTK